VGAPSNLSPICQPPGAAAGVSDPLDVGCFRVTKSPVATLGLLGFVVIFVWCMCW